MRNGMRLALVALVAGLAGAVPVSAKRAAGPPIPAGWTIDSSAQGDLTSDGLADTALVIRQMNPAKVIKNEGLGAPELDTNPRRLLVFQRLPNGSFVQIGSSDRLIPSAGSTESPCLADPLEEGGVAIAGQVLSVGLHNWLSCGGWGASNSTYKFRREGKRFRLIGFDHIEFMRNSGAGTQVSVNFMTSRKATSPWSIEDSQPPRWRWTRIRPQRHYLDTINPDACTAIDAKTSLC